jgi:hypothetical protein
MQPRAWSVSQTRHGDKTRKLPIWWIIRLSGRTYFDGIVAMAARMPPLGLPGHVEYPGIRRTGCMRGCKIDQTAGRCRDGHGELCDLLRCRRRCNPPVPAVTRRARFTKAASPAPEVLQAA